jgi:hypothetical protein
MPPSACDARASRALAKVLSRSPGRPASALIEDARAALRAALEHACVLERRAALRAAASASSEARKAYDAYIESLSAVDEACANLFAIEGHMFRARVLAQEADVAAINRAIAEDRTPKKKSNNYHVPTPQSAALAQRLKDAVPLPMDAVTPSQV